jgi:hypothetical protein
MKILLPIVFVACLPLAGCLSNGGAYGYAPAADNQSHPPNIYRQYCYAGWQLCAYDNAHNHSNGNPNN